MWEIFPTLESAHNKMCGGRGDKPIVWCLHDGKLSATHSEFKANRLERAKKNIYIENIYIIHV
jgi:hypothetical protein